MKLSSEQKTTIRATIKFLTEKKQNCSSEMEERIYSGIIDDLQKQIEDGQIPVELENEEVFKNTQDSIDEKYQEKTAIPKDSGQQSFNFDVDSDNEDKKTNKQQTDRSEEKAVEKEPKKSIPEKRKKKDNGGKKKRKKSIDETDNIEPEKEQLIIDRQSDTEQKKDANSDTEEHKKVESDQEKDENEQTEEIENKDENQMEGENKNQKSDDEPNKKQKTKRGPLYCKDCHLPIKGVDNHVHFVVCVSNTACLAAHKKAEEKYNKDSKKKKKKKKDKVIEEEE